MRSVIDSNPEMSDETWLSKLDVDARLVRLLVAGTLAYFLIHCFYLFGRFDFAGGTIDPDHLTDFFVFYSAAKLVLSGEQTALLYDSATFKAFQEGLGAAAASLHPYNYPPSFLFFVLPFGFFDFAWALVFWLLATGLFFLGSLNSLRLSAWEALAVVASPAAVVNVSAGQNGYLTSGLLILGLATLGRSPRLSGVAFGLLTVKPQLGLLIPVALLARRRWTTIGFALITLLALFGLSLALFGAEIWARFIAFLSELSALSAQQVGSGFAIQSANLFAALRQLGLGEDLAYGLQGTVALVVVVLVYRLWRSDAERDVKIAGLLAATLLAPPFGFFYDLPFLMVAVVLLYRQASQHGYLPFERFILAAVWFLPFLGPWLNERGLPLAPLVIAGLFALAIRRGR